MINRMLNLIGIARATVVDDSGELQLVQVTERALGEGGKDLIIDKVPRITEFGFTSVPPLDSVVTMLRRNGERGLGFVTGTSHSPSRLKDLKPGDSALYDVRGAKVVLTEDGLLIDCAGLPAVLKNATTVRIEADKIECTGDIVSRADGTPVSLNALRDAYHQHKHGGVQAGSATSGTTDHDI